MDIVFFTKIRQVSDIWHEVLPEEDFLCRERFSRILYKKKFFHYPLVARNALFGLGLWDSLLIVLSYFRAWIFPERPEKTFEQWVSNRFGKRLYRIFFKTYTEKVWGIPCNEITAEWAAQRIRGLSLVSAVKNALIKSQPDSGKDVIKTLVNAFHYPKRGPGMMWETVAQMVQANGSQLLLGAEAETVFWANTRVEAVRAKGQEKCIKGTHLISTMPIRELISKLDPPVPARVSEAASRLNYRDFLTIALVVSKRDVFSDQWIYIHDPEVKVGRIQNFKNWSPQMVPDPQRTCLGLEYFCFEGEGLWNMSDQDLIELGKNELEQLGLVEGSEVEDGAVVRMPKAYPVYDSTYRESLKIVRQFLDGIDNLQLVGRNGMHKYNNQDHAMFTAILAVENILGARHDIWRVNTDGEYHEELDERGNQKMQEITLLNRSQPKVPSRLSEEEPYPPRKENE